MLGLAALAQGLGTLQLLQLLLLLLDQLIKAFVIDHSFVVVCSCALPRIRTLATPEYRAVIQGASRSVLPRHLFIIRQVLQLLTRQQLQVILAASRPTTHVHRGGSVPSLPKRLHVLQSRVVRAPSVARTALANASLLFLSATVLVGSQVQVLGWNDFVIV